MSCRRVLLLFVMLSLLPLAPGVTWAEEFTIGYLELRNDPRYSIKRTFARYLGQAIGRPYAAARVAIKEIKFHGAAAGVTFGLKRHRGKTVAELLAGIEELKNESGAQFFLLDAPADVVSELAAKTKGREIVLFNVSAREDRLRQAECQSHLLHVIPSNAMLMDALVQYLVFRKWREVLVLEGPSPDDKELTLAFERAAKRYGVKKIEKRPFVLSNDPRERDENNIALLTANADYQVVFVADTDGEFAREVPYHTVKPQLVVGTEGLAAMAWHWSWERHGAPQLEGRFEKQAQRSMTGVDWSAWMAVKAIATSVQRTKSADFVTLKDYLLGDEIILDGFKGNRSSFRPWNNQLRQPILLATHNWVVDRAPIKGFLHQKNNLDTLGFDKRESECRF